MTQGDKIWNLFSKLENTKTIPWIKAYLRPGIDIYLYMVYMHKFKKWKIKIMSCAWNAKPTLESSHTAKHCRGPIRVHTRSIQQDNIIYQYLTKIKV